MADFSWAAAADVANGLVGGLSKGLDALGKAQIAKSNAKAANIVREGQNEVRRSATGLAATIRSINDKRALGAAAERVDALTTNALRTQDAFSRRNFEQSVKGAEVQGRMSAAAAASGLGGAGIEALSRTTDLQLARQREAIESQQEDQLFDAAEATTGVIPNALRGLANSPLVLGYDRTENAIPPTPNIANALIAGLMDKKASMQTLLGSLKDNSTEGPIAQPKASFAFEATSTPVTQSSVSGTDLDPLVGTDYVDRSDRLASAQLN